jgi:hypothetical protein
VKGREKEGEREKKGEKKRERERKSSSVEVKRKTSFKEVITILK